MWPLWQKAITLNSVSREQHSCPAPSHFVEREAGFAYTGAERLPQEFGFPFQRNTFLTGLSSPVCSAEVEVNLGWTSSSAQTALTNFILLRFSPPAVRRCCFSVGFVRGLGRSIKMSSKKTMTTTTYRTVMASPEPVTRKVITGTTVIPAGVMPSVPQVSPVPYAVNGSNYGTVRYLVPFQQQQQQQSYVLMQQPMMQQPMMQQMVSPVYLQNLQHLSVSSQDSTDLMYQQHGLTEVSPCAHSPEND